MMTTCPPTLTIVSVLCWWMCAAVTCSEDEAVGSNDANVAVSMVTDGNDGVTWPVAAAVVVAGGKPSEDVAAVVRSRRRSDLIRGLFGAYRWNRKRSDAPPHKRYRLTDRPVDAQDGDGADGGWTNATRDGGSGETTVTGPITAVAGPERTVFGTEDECVSAANDERRPCVCYAADYLDWVAQRLDEEMAVASGDAVAAARAFDCQSYKAVPPAFVVRPTGRNDDNDDDDDDRTARPDGEDPVPEAAVARNDLQPAKVIDYRFDSSHADDHFAIHYGLLGSDMKIRCLANGTEIDNFKWTYKTGKHNTGSMIIGNKTISLSILGLVAADSKNYTCIPYNMSDAKNVKTDNAYTHYVIAVANPIYEIRSSAVYKTSGSSICTPENVGPVRKQLPSFMRTEVCPEGSTHYACNVVVKLSKCVDQNTLEIKLLVTLNEKADFLNKIRTSRKGRNALYYQQALARIMTVLAANLNKSLTVQIVSKSSLIDTRFESERGRTKVKTSIACPPGFGIREVFCGACPPHHYSANKLMDCEKCPQGFHQPVAGSEKCLKCPHPFASGCYMKEIPTYIYYVTILVFFLVFGLFVGYCLCCCREENEKSIRIIPRHIKRKLKRSKDYQMIP